MKNKLLSLLLSTYMATVLAFPLMADGKAPGDITTIYVHLNFEGDPGFPSITAQRNTRGLARFTGDVFRLPHGIRDQLVDRIIDRVREDYASFGNIVFVTDTTGLEWWYTWGIDDSAYAYDTGKYPDGLPNPEILPIDPYAACPDGVFGKCGRLLGKAGNYATTDEKDAWYNLIFHPMHARTFAGSFALDLGSADLSEPPLFWGDSLVGTGKKVDIETLANALGNSASHEIGHLFGARHNHGAMMSQREEKYEAFYNKSFSDASLITLRKTLVDAVIADRFEPNDTPLPPLVVPAGNYQNLTLDNPFDEDFYVVAVTEDESEVSVSFVLDRSNYGGDITPPFDDWANVDIRYRDCDGCPEVLASPEVTGSGYIYREFGVPSGREYQFHVYQASPRIPMNYSMTVFAGKGDLPADRYEPNDDPGSATALSGCTAASEVNIDNNSDVDYYKIEASGYSVNAEIAFETSAGNLELFLDGVQATDSALSQDGTKSILRIVGCGQSPSYVKVEGERNFYSICVTKVLLQEGCPGYDPLIPLMGNGTFVYTGAQYGPGSPPEETAILREQMYAHKTSETSSTVLWSIGGWLDLPSGSYLPLVLEANCSKESESLPADIVAKILSQNLAYIAWSGTGQGRCFGTGTPGVITGVNAVIDNMTSICGFGCVAPGHGILTVNGESEETPVAEAGGPYSGTQGSPVTFDASGSSDPNGTIVLYEWDWNNDGIYDESTPLPGITHTWDSPYVGFVGLRVTDNDGFTAVATASVEIKSLSFRVSGGAYFYPESPAYRASFSMDVTGPTSPSGWLKYYYSRTRMNYVSTGITSVSVSGNSATISGTGTVNGAGGYTFMATVANGTPDSFGITINKPDGSPHYSTGPTNISGGDLMISQL